MAHRLKLRSLIVMTITRITAKGIMADHNDLGMYIAHDRAM
ncbi:hypothetical protein BMETH_643_1 [methanotrophic bacterial endosymbiont of Bathymodiolus sp.]|nr:hypothetical protein BMETH_643_1 [methanotrophic bacterial endosymbiont of Bathymodiolus sp.]